MVRHCHLSFKKIAMVSVYHFSANIPYNRLQKSKKYKKEGWNLTNKNDSNDMHRNQPKVNNGGQPEPLSGSKKVKNRNHTRQKHNAGHDM